MLIQPPTTEVETVLIQPQHAHRHSPVVDTLPDDKAAPPLSTNSVDEPVLRRSNRVTKPTNRYTNNLSNATLIQGANPLSTKVLSRASY